MLRFEGPIKILIRWVVQDHERDGRPVRAGDRVFLVLQSANRDESTFADPDRFDIGRPGDIRVLGDVTWRPNIASRAVTGLRIGYARGATEARKGRAHAATTRTGAATRRRRAQAP